MEATFNNPSQKFTKTLMFLILTGLIIVTMALLSDIVGANLGNEINSSNFNQCIEEEILMCWDAPNPDQKADISFEDGNYKMDIYHYVRDEWVKVTTIDDISCLEELGSYLEARGFIVMWP